MYWYIVHLHIYQYDTVVISLKKNQNVTNSQYCFTKDKNTFQMSYALFTKDNLDNLKTYWNYKRAPFFLMQSLSRQNRDNYNFIFLFGIIHQLLGDFNTLTCML